MKKYYILILCLLFLTGCSTKPEPNKNNDGGYSKPTINEDVNSTEDKNNDETNNDNSISLEDLPEIEKYSTNLINKLNSKNNDNILSFNNVTFEKEIYFVEYTTQDETSFTIRFNENFEFLGITLHNPNFDEYTQDFLQIKTKYLSECSFYNKCLNNSHCSNIMFGLTDGNYTIDNFEIITYNSIKTFVISKEN